MHARAREAWCQRGRKHRSWRMTHGCIRRARRQRDGNARMKDREWPGQPWYGAGTRAQEGGVGESILECRGYSRSRGDPGTRPCPGDARLATPPGPQLHLDPVRPRITKFSYLLFASTATIPRFWPGWRTWIAVGWWRVGEKVSSGCVYIYISVVYGGVRILEFRYGALRYWLL